MKNNLLKKMFFVAIMLTGSVIFAQTVSGTISDESGPLPGASILVKGTANGVNSDFDGNYTLNNVPSDGVLVVSFLGFITQEISADGKTTVDVTLEVDASQLDEVVVTALGIKKSSKSLAYSVAKVDGDEFTESRTPNLGNALTGKVAGVTVSTPATGAGGASRVLIRGGSSLTGNDQPLYVVNGIPINNQNMGAAGTWGGSDSGDGLTSINPDDIENLTVLKGNSAAALYGSRAANGVILITTKSGAKGTGIGVSFNSNFQMETAIDHRDLQTEYGYGTDGLKPINQAGALANGQSNWGAKHDGSMVVQFDGVERPYSDLGEGLNDFFETGTTFSNTLGLSGGNDMHVYRFSASHLDNDGIMPNSGFDKTQFAANISGTYGKLSSKISGQYSKENRLNPPRVSDTPGNGSYTAHILPKAISYASTKGTTDKLGAEEDGTELNHLGTQWAQNSYWAAYQYYNERERDRVFGNVSLRYDFTDYLYVQGRIGMDLSVNDNASHTPYGTGYSPNGSRNEASRTIRETNSDLLVGFNKEFGEFGVDVTVGGNIQRNTDEQKSIGGSFLNIPFWHSVNNVKNQSYSYFLREQGVNSYFGSANISYKDVLFLTVSGREDTFSTLAEGNNKLFYPSAGLSFVLSDAVELPELFSYVKVRGTWAQVGGGAPSPYALGLTYGLNGNQHDGAVLGNINGGSIPNAGLQPYTSTEIESGIDAKFLKGRLGVDFTYYDRVTENDILNTSISGTSGFGSTSVNIGELTNKGIELQLSGTPIRTENFEWRATFNMANNTSEAIDLGSDAEGNPIDFINREEARTRQERIRHVVGQPLGLIAGYKHKTINGEKVYTSAGYPVRSDGFEIIAEGRHPFSAGLSNNFKYKDFNLSFLIDMRAGGSVMSGSNNIYTRRGLHKQTLEGRENGITVTGVDAAGAALTVNIPASDIDTYYAQYSNITEYSVYDASYGKLREFSFGYSIPKTVLEKTPLESLNFSLVGRNLLLLWSNVPNIDPESGYSSSGGSQGLEYFALPVTRSFGFNISANF